jgi:hypothetical protein
VAERWFAPDRTPSTGFEGLEAAGVTPASVGAARRLLTKIERRGTDQPPREQIVRGQQGHSRERIKASFGVKLQEDLMVKPGSAGSPPATDNSKTRLDTSRAKLSA